jgi:hypothetical protein
MAHRIPLKQVSHKLEQSYELENFNNIAYQGDILISGQPISVIFDTGSDWLVVESAQCDTCSAPKKFNSLDSPSIRYLTA